MHRPSALLRAAVLTLRVKTAGDFCSRLLTTGTAFAASSSLGHALMSPCLALRAPAALTRVRCFYGYRAGLGALLRACVLCLATTRLRPIAR